MLRTHHSSIQNSWKRIAGGSKESTTQHQKDLVVVVGIVVGPLGKDGGVKGVTSGAIIMGPGQA